jgi:hypothetical protein
VIWNAIWQVVNLYLSGGGCLRQWGSICLVVALALHNRRQLGSKRP